MPSQLLQVVVRSPGHSERVAHVLRDRRDLSLDGVSGNSDGQHTEHNNPEMHQLPPLFQASANRHYDGAVTRPVVDRLTDSPMRSHLTRQLVS